MSDSLHFMMGKFRAEIPGDRSYARNHMWAQPCAAGSGAAAPEDAIVLRYGFTAYAVRLLQDVYFLEWTVDPGTDLVERQEIGAIESKKAESSLYSPVTGRLLRFNEELLSDPSAINVDKYGSGWLFETQAPRPDQVLLTPHQYVEHLAAIWEVTQRTIKGQLND